LFARARQKRNATRAARLKRATEAAGGGPRVPLHKGVATASDAARKAVMACEEAAKKAGWAYITSGEPAHMESFGHWRRQALICAEDEKKHQETVQPLEDRHLPSAEKERIRDKWPQVWDKADKVGKSAKKEIEKLDARSYWA